MTRIPPSYNAPATSNAASAGIPRTIATIPVFHNQSIPGSSVDCCINTTSFVLIQATSVKKIPTYLPFGNSPIIIAPHRIFPMVPLLCRFADDIFINTDAETRTCWNSDVAVLILEDGSILQVIEQVVCQVIVNTQTLLLNKDVRRTGIQL